MHRLIEIILNYFEPIVKFSQIYKQRRLYQGKRQAVSLEGRLNFPRRAEFH